MFPVSGITFKELDTFAALAHDVAMSAIAVGFKNVVFIEDHGGGQQPLQKVAEAMNKEFGPSGVHVYYIPDLYYKEKDFMRDYLPKHGIAIDGHAGTDDTSGVYSSVNDKRARSAGTTGIR